jgi:hypothetical protein
VNHPVYVFQLTPNQLGGKCFYIKQKVNNLNETDWTTEDNNTKSKKFNLQNPEINRTNLIGCADADWSETKSEQLQQLVDEVKN